MLYFLKNYLENKMNLIEEYKKFLENGKTERECVSLIIHLAEKNGYKDIQKTDSLDRKSVV